MCEGFIERGITMELVMIACVSLGMVIGTFLGFSIDDYLDNKALKELANSKMV
jgi:hypothetical protein